MDQKLTTTLSQYSKIILVGGWTGGHIQPIISLVHSLSYDMNIYLWIGWTESQEQEAATAENIEFQSIPTLKLTTTRSWKLLFYPLYVITGFRKARRILQISQKIEENIAIFSKWWPGSVAIGIAAWSLSIPLYIHESDTMPGRSNRILGRFAEEIFLGFESAQDFFDKKKCQIVWQIIDPVFTEVIQDRGYKIQWKTDKKHILVICGSQWARAIFEAIIEQFSGNDEYEWIISLGRLNANMKANFEKMDNTQALEWISQEDIASLLVTTDLAITRWSATTLAEIDIFGIEKIIIPLPHSANNHQYWNAREYEKNGDILLEQKNIYQLKETIKKYVHRKEK